MDHQGGGSDSGEAAVRLPSKYSLQLCRVGFGPRKPRPTNRNVFLNPFTRSCRIVDKRHGRLGGLLRAHFVTRLQHLGGLWFGAHRGRPAAVQPSISGSTRFGYCSANSCAIMPPIETPNTWALSTPAASRTTAASDAINAMGYGPCGTSLCPMPRLSRARVR